ncbi:ATP-dependent DNA helicase RecQ [Thermonema lapsum]|uniref:DNA helicase RecQ n=1 Tax=Thermonema lapsum TaxID=28195 RepID=A0A846MQ08_9BACT|nr:DNA helicase RecQ [Thermonema lapsum]NIK73653.1 ATP-dependent DNA helicase RecQ [Thermonema lapsum]
MSVGQKNAQLKSKLKEIFGYNQFRGNQEQIIENLLAGKHTFVIMPTGAGKSLCYQLPAVIMQGTALVISPLIALMKNQVDQLNAVGVEAHFLNSTLSKSEIQQVRESVLAGSTKLLYVAPESLGKEENLDLFKQAKISFVAVDEAHCISEWGHDFRPEYRKIRSVIDQIGELPIIALTATATPKVQQDIIKNLGIEDATVFKSSFNRPNLYYEVRPKIESEKQLIRFIKKHKGKSGIVYCLSRKTVEEIAELLNVNDIKALPYHAGLDADVRMRNQDAFLNEEVDVIVATIAFGMGIDKPDVRFVVHYDTPKSLEGYYQETGRAGRDGLEGHCLLLYSYDDIQKLDKFNKDKPVTERDNAKYLLAEMADYAESGLCRRRQLLHYFGEYYEEDNCEMCDNCTNPTPQFKVDKEVQWALEAVEATGERFGIDHLIDVLMEQPNDYIKSYEHNKLPIYGKGKKYSEKFWRSLYRQILIMGFLSKEIVEQQVIFKLTEKGKDFIAHPYIVTLHEDHDYSKTTLEELEKQESSVATQTKAYDEVLYDLLRNLRKRIAKEKGLPPYVIFQDISLEEMATTYPTTEQELEQINGVGRGKVIKFGRPFLEAIRNYVEEHDIETASEVVVKSTPSRSKTKIYIIQQIDRKIDLEEIADSLDMEFSELLDEIESICYSGVRLNLDYYINQLLEPERQEEIYDFFRSSETDSIDEAFEDALAEFEDEYTEEELRLMRIKFISELGN